MKLLVRSQELESAYDKIMGRQSLQLAGPMGSGRSHLQQALSQRLSGRRIIIPLQFAGIFEFHHLVHHIRESFESAESQNAGLAYQLRRLHQEHPAHRIHKRQDLFDYLQALMNFLFQAGQDILICLEDPEFCEVADFELTELIKPFQKMRAAHNIQLLINSEEPIFKGEELFDLHPPQVEDIWAEASSENIACWHYSKGNLAFLKNLEEHIKQEGSFKAEEFFKPYQGPFTALKTRFTNLQWRLLRALASEESIEQPHAFDFLVAHKLGAASSVERALRNLLDTGFIERKEGAYTIKNPLLHRWLQYLYFQKSLANFTAA